MRPWHKRAVRQVLTGAAKSLLPFKSEIRAMKRRLRPYVTETANDEWLFENGLEQIGLLHEAGIEIDGARVIEVGSGWCPIIPLLFVLAGAETVLLTDIENHLDGALLRSACDFIACRAPLVSERLGRGTAEIVGILSLGRSGFDRALSNLGIAYAAPFRPEKAPAGSADIIVSRAVLEHVPPGDIRRMAAAWRHLLVPGGATCHIVDNSDHWEHRDKTISRLNFLTFGDASWRLLCAATHSYTNRLRHSDYLHLFAEAGFEVVLERATLDRKAEADLEALHLAAPFRGRHPSDLAAVMTAIVARSPGPTEPARRPIPRASRSRQETARA